MNDDAELIFKRYDEAKNKILLYVRSVVTSDACYEAVRRLILDELGRSGAEGHAREILNKMARNGQAGISESCKGGGGYE